MGKLFSEWFINFETRDAISLIVIVGYVVAEFVGVSAGGGLKELALLVAGFHFANKATRDKI